MILYDIIKELYRYFRPIVLHGENNIINIKSSYRRMFVTVNGDNNTIDIPEKCRIKNTTISINGNNNHIALEENTKLDGPISIKMEGNSNLYIGSNSGIRGVTFVLKDANIIIGRNCMFSYNIIIRNNDSHYIINNDTNEITNPASDIIIEDHVWLCERVSIMKGVKIGRDSVIAFGTIVTRDCPSNSIMAGVPGKVVKDGINWKNK